MTIPEKADEAVLSATFTLVFRQGRSPPSCPQPNETDLLNRIRDAVPAASPAACRDALIRVRRLSSDVLDVCGAFREGNFGTGREAKSAAIQKLAQDNPGFTGPEYETAFAVGMLWTAF
jgi:hypothetical protein